MSPWNAAFLHIATNHIPVISLPLCVTWFAIGLARKNQDISRLALGFIVLTALVTIFVYQTGGPAAHIVRDLPGIVRAQIHDHAEAADGAFWAMEALGVAALLTLWFGRRPGPAAKTLVVVTLLGGIFVSMWLTWVAHLGGLIRHPEIKGNASPAAIAVPAPLSLPR